MLYVKLPAFNTVHYRRGADRSAPEYSDYVIKSPSGNIAYHGGEQNQRADCHGERRERLLFAFCLYLTDSRQQRLSAEKNAYDTENYLHFDLRMWNSKFSPLRAVIPINARIRRIRRIRI